MSAVIVDLDTARAARATRDAQRQVMLDRLRQLNAPRLIAATAAALAVTLFMLSRR